MTGGSAVSVRVATSTGLARSLPTGCEHVCARLSSVQVGLSFKLCLQAVGLAGGVVSVRLRVTNFKADSEAVLAEACKFFFYFCLQTVCTVN